VTQHQLSVDAVCETEIRLFYLSMQAVLPLARLSAIASSDQMTREPDADSR
jgi:hypothetical protein